VNERNEFSPTIYLCIRYYSIVWPHYGKIGGMSKGWQGTTDTGPDRGATKWKNFISINGFCVSFPEDWHQLQGTEYTRQDEYVFSPTPGKLTDFKLIYLCLASDPLKF